MKREIYRLTSCLQHGNSSQHLANFFHGMVRAHGYRRNHHCCNWRFDTTSSSRHNSVDDLLSGVLGLVPALRPNSRKAELLGMGLSSYDLCDHRHRHYVQCQQYLHHVECPKTPARSCGSLYQWHPIPEHEFLPRFCGLRSRSTIPYRVERELQSGILDGSRLCRGWRAVGSGWSKNRQSEKRFDNGGKEGAGGRGLGKKDEQKPISTIYCFIHQ